MGKHIDAKTKYNYLMRYLNGESPTKLGLEINDNVKSPKHIILRWNRHFQKYEIDELKSKSSKKKIPKKKKSKLDPTKMDRDELIDYVRIMEETIKEYDDFFKKKSRSRFVFNIILKFSKKFNKSILWLCNFYGVSRSGYYKWLNKPIITGNYNHEWLNIIRTEFELQKGNFGSERIWASLKKKGILNVNIKTIKRYMSFMGLKARIRVPKKKREIKDTTTIDKNYINQDFRDNLSRVKVFTDTTQMNYSWGTVYYSAVIDSKGDLLSLDASYRNNEKLIQKNILSGVLKIGRKYYIQFDNAAFYKNDHMKQLLKKTKGIASYCYPGKSLDNRPIEYFWSILKHEYLTLNKAKNMNEVIKQLQRIKFHYNHIRIQKQLKWRAPAQARA